ncbi:hypothetical protein TNCV_4229011 [Trichonephila clavipes]|nr:hypothetical protein TNCV_4229011 [Trichonephila clavipes]
MCWMKPSNCDSDLSMLDARGNDGPMKPVAPILLYHCPVRLYYSTPFAAEGDARKASTAWITLVETPSVCIANAAMNGGHGQRNVATLCLPSNPVSAYNITIVGFEFGDTVVKGC